MEKSHFFWPKPKISTVVPPVENFLKKFFKRVFCGQNLLKRRENEKKNRKKISPRGGPLGKIFFWTLTFFEKNLKKNRNPPCAPPCEKFFENFF